MRIHGNLTNLREASVEYAGMDRAENAARAAKTRRQLQKAAQTISATDLETPDPGASLLIGEWLNVNHNQSLADDDYIPGPAHCEPFPG
jgi:hypothetical protein